MQSHQLVLLLVLFCALLELGAEMAIGIRAQNIKQATATSSSSSLLVLGVVAYAVIGYLYARSLEFGQISIANTLWQILSVVLVAAAGIFYFKDRLSLGQLVGLIVVTAGGVLLLSGEHGDTPWTRPRFSV
jgi:multidrug transporter EmrE-like cation transporter